MNVLIKLGNRTTLALMIATVLVTIVLFRLVLYPAYVTSESMNPTFKTGDFVMGQRLFSSVERNDIIIASKDGQQITKRIVGMPGDVLEIKQGFVYINGDKIGETIHPDQQLMIAEQQYFLAGDNRNNSYDSRYWPVMFIDKNQIEAKVFWISH